MNVKLVLVVVLVIDLVITERDIADYRIKAVIFKLGFLKALYLNIRIGILLLGDSSRKAVKLNTVKLTCSHSFGHYSEKVSDTHSRL